MLQAVAAVLFLVLAFAVLALLGQHLPPSYGRGLPFMLPVIGLVIAAWALASSREHNP
jgi:protein-S-isoprenylcysteine O-methyltransferase Ste14